MLTLLTYRLVRSYKLLLILIKRIPSIIIIIIRKNNFWTFLLDFALLSEGGIRYRSGLGLKGLVQSKRVKDSIRKFFV